MGEVASMVQMDSMAETQASTAILKVVGPNHRQTLEMVSIREILGAVSMEQMWEMDSMVEMETQASTAILKVVAPNHRQTLEMVSIREILGAVSTEEMM